MSDYIQIMGRKKRNREITRTGPQKREWMAVADIEYYESRPDDPGIFDSIYCPEIS